MTIRVSGAQFPQQAAQPRLGHRDAAGAGGEVGPGHMDEHRAAAPGDPGSRVVVYFYNKIIELIVATEPVAGRVRRYPDRLVVAPVVRVLAPGVLAVDPARPGGGGRPRARGRRATTAARAGKFRAGSRRRLRACWPKCRRGRAQPERRAVRRSASRACAIRARRGPTGCSASIACAGRCLSRIESIAAGACALSPECSTSRNCREGPNRRRS